MKKIKISKEVIASLMPTRNLLNLPADQLLDQTFTLNSVVENEDYNENDGTIGGPVRLRYMNSKTNAIAQFPVRGLLYAQTADVKSSSKFDPENTETVVMHTRLLEEAANSEEVDIPASFTVVDVQNRTNIDGKTVFPTYSYQKFQERVDAMSEGEDISEIYQDFAFMSTLPGTALAERFKDIEPVKNIVISLG